MRKFAGLLCTVLGFRTCYQSCLLFVVAFGVVGINPARCDEADSDEIAYATAELVAHLDCRAIRESSGLASSRRHRHVLWTHNDSGGEPAIYAFDQEGRDLGKVQIDGAKAVDWEDMASFQLDGKPWLLLADTGDNQLQRTTYQLYLIPEPNLDAPAVRVEHVINFTYEGGSFDCEAVAVDVANRQILLASKDWTFSGKLFSLPLPTGEAPAEAQVDGDGLEKSDDLLLIAQHIASVKLPGVTAIDISPDARRAVVLTYAHAYEYRRNEGEDWMTAFARGGREVQLPPRKQSEAICFGIDGKVLYCTCEACPTPLFCVQAALSADEN